MKKAAVDLETYFRNVSGIHTYIDGLLPHLVGAAPEVEWTLFASADYEGKLRAAPLGRAANARYVARPRSHRAERLSFFALGGRPVERDIGPHDVYYSPTTPGFATRGAYVMTVHDIAWRRCSGLYPRWSIWARRLGLRKDLRRARFVISDSEATKKDLVELAGAEADRVRVVYPGLPDPDSSGRRRDAQAVERTLLRLGIRRPYVVSPAGDHSPRKNLDRLVRAVARVRRSAPDVQLVMLGKARFDTSAFERVIAEERLAQAVVRPGFLSESDLLDVMAGARVLAFPSLYEGFGFPILEGMASGAPVVTSNVSSMPELAGDAALLVDPADVEGIAGAILRLIEDDRTHETMKRKGLERAATFTWERTAVQALEVLRAAAGEA